MRCWLFVLLLCACARVHEPVQLFGSDTEIAKDDYPRVLERWSRQAEIYHSLETKLFVTATFHTPEFRRAFALAFPDIYGHGGKITRQELVDLSGDVERYHNFFLAVYTADTKWNDLAKPDSIWRLTLISDDDVMVDPEEIVPVKIDANIQAVYPQLGRFYQAYVVRFPMADLMGRTVIAPTSKRFSVRFASALGQAQLAWDLIPAPQTPSGS